jgi:NAD-reducing hydrogenase small subunit
MSFLDMDERLLDLAGRMDLVFSPFMDVKEFPEHVDVTLVEGAVANEDHVAQIRRVRERTRILVSFGDCAVTGNVTALRNPLGGADPVLRRAYQDPGLTNPAVPDAPGIVPRLLDTVQTIRAFVHVDYYLPGCPPPADVIYYAISELIAGRPLHLAGRATLG